MRFAMKLGELYLEREIAADTIELDDLFLEKSDGQKAAWKWLAGVNVSRRPMTVAGGRTIEFLVDWYSP